jgi:hypothetical protein
MTNEREALKARIREYLSGEVVMLPEHMIDGLAALSQPSPAVPDGRLHADGYFSWNNGKRPDYIADRGLPCDFYLAPVAAALQGDGKP